MTVTNSGEECELLGRLGETQIAQKFTRAQLSWEKPTMCQ